MFAREVDSNETMQTAIADAILFKVNGEKGEGPEIAKKFGAKDSGRFVNGVLDGFVKRRAEAG